MKYKKTAVFLNLFLGIALSGCQGIKASTDNAEATTSVRYDKKGNIIVQPEVSVPLWSWKKMKPKPKDITPVKD